MATISLASSYKMTLSGIGEKTWGIALSDIKTKIDNAVPNDAHIDKITLNFSGSVYNNNILKAYNEYVVCCLTNSDADASTDTSGGTGGTNLFKQGAFEINGRSTKTFDNKSVDITKYFGAVTPHNVQNTSYSRLTISYTSKAVYTKDITFNLSLEVTYSTHSYTTETSRTNATCLSAGSVTKKCSCGATKTETLAQLPHSYTGEIRSDGNGKTGTHSYKCINGCGNYGGAKTHTWNSGVQTTAPTCTANGVKTYTCTASGCGGTYTESISKLGHSWGTTSYTWSSDGKTCTAKRVCGRSGCGATETATATITSKVKTDATCTTKGTTTYTATFGISWATTQTKDIQDIAAKGHTEVITPAVEPTYTETGLTAGKKCSVCNTVIIAQQLVYLITFEDGDGTTLETVKVVQGGIPSCSKTPTKENTAEFKYTFSGWSPEIGSANSNQVYKPVFTAIKQKYYFGLRATPEDGGSVQGSQEGEYEYGEPISVTAIPATGYEFTGWFVTYINREDDWWEEFDKSINPLEFYLKETTDVAANFKKQLYLITTKVSPTEAGTIVGGGYHEYKETITLTARASDGYRFVEWSDGDTSNPRTVTVSGKATYTAVFEKLPPEFTSVAMTYLGKQISVTNKVPCGEGFIISVGVT